MKDAIEYRIAEAVKNKGGRTYYVGGYVRDQLLGVDNKDIDIEVHGIKEDKLFKILSKFGTPLTYGKQFGIYSLANHNIDIALPRTEKKIGNGHKDFEIVVDSNLSIEDAISRRDFTINAIYKDVLTDEIIDPYNGTVDLKYGILKHLNANTFVEDPLRVLRACQFAARFNFTISQETIDLCKTIDITTLSFERVEEELKKALLKSNKPSVFFDYLKQMNRLDYWFKNVNFEYIDEAVKNIDKIENKYAYLLCVLGIDTNFDITKFTKEKNVIEYYDNTMKYLKKPYKNNLSLFKIFDGVKNVKEFIEIRYSVDKNNDIYDRYKKYVEYKEKPCVTGDDLISNGLKPSPKFNEALRYANDLRLLGIEKSEALKIVLDFINKTSNKE